MTWNDVFWIFIFKWHFMRWELGQTVKTLRLLRLRVSHTRASQRIFLQQNAHSTLLCFKMVSVCVPWIIPIVSEFIVPFVVQCALSWNIVWPSSVRLPYFLSVYCSYARRKRFRWVYCVLCESSVINSKTKGIFDRTLVFAKSNEGNVRRCKRNFNNFIS